LACSGVWTVATQAVDVAGRNILVTVLDKAGAPVRDLTAEEFAVVEDGVRREVTSAALAAEPLFVSVLIDNAKAPLGAGEPTRDMRTSLSTFIKTLQTTRPDTQVALTTVGGAGVLIKNFTDKTEDLDKVVRRGVRTTALLPAALERILKNLADVLTSQYVVTYERPDGPPAKSIVPAAKRGAQFLLAPWDQQ
jgi:hypothetical protein